MEIFMIRNITDKVFFSETDEAEENKITLSNSSLHVWLNNLIQTHPSQDNSRRESKGLAVILDLWSSAIKNPLSLLGSRLE